MGAPVTLLGRRDLLSRLTRWALAAASIGGGWIALRPLWPRKGRASALRLPAGRPAALGVGQVSTRLLRDHFVFVVRDAGGYYALSARCTHLGCRLRYDRHAERFLCNCHGSVFSRDGAVLRGPASRTLERVQIKLERGVLRVDPGIRYRREQGEWSSPGAYVRHGGRSR